MKIIIISNFRIIRKHDKNEFRSFFIDFYKYLQVYPIIPKNIKGEHSLLKRTQFVISFIRKYLYIIVKQVSINN